MTETDSAEVVGTIHKAVLHHLATWGWDGLDVDVVAEQSGCEASLIRERWETLDDLVVDALATAQSQALALREPPGNDLRGDLVFLLQGQARDLAEDHGKALRPVMTSRGTHPQLVRRVMSAVMVPRQQLWVQVVADAVARGEARSRAMTPRVLAAGPRLLVAEDMDDGPLTDTHVEELVDEVVLPLLTR